MQAGNPEPCGTESFRIEKEQWKERVTNEAKRVKAEATTLHANIAEIKKAYGDKTVCALYALGIHLYLTKNPSLGKYYRFCRRYKIFTKETIPWKNSLMEEFKNIPREVHQESIDMFMAMQTYDNVVCEDEIQPLQQALAKLSQSFQEFMNDHFDNCPVGWHDERTEFLRELSESFHKTQ